MPNAWTTWVKGWAKRHNEAYGCALSNPKCSAAYRMSKQPNQPMEEAKPNVEPTLKPFDLIPPAMKPPAMKAKRGRPEIHTTAEAKYAAKLHSNKIKRRERSAEFPSLELVPLSKKAASKEVSKKVINSFYSSPLNQKKLVIVNK